ncbi:MAG: outer membrane protein OmpA-like peptidoglycan-associated protein [bacterium]|jgi:outer membrane protein OmpA-like peptidoglycan-associated protein
MKKIYIFIILIAASTTITFAQNKDTKKADDLYSRLAYTDAAEAYQKLLKKGKGDKYVFEQLANSYYFINDSKKAETYYKRVVKRKKVKPETVYNYAQTLKANGKNGNYNTWMKKFAEMKPADSRAVAFMKDPNYLPRYLENAKKFSLTNMKEINTEYSEFGGTVIDKSFYFSSARNTARKKYGWNEEPFLDVYAAEIIGGTVKNADLIAGDVNTKYHEGNVAITADGKRMYFDRNDYFKGKYKKSGEGVSQINLFTTVKENGVWKDIQPVSFNNSQNSFGQPALSPDGNTLYFVSDMPGGKGMSDIYKVAVNKDGSLGTPENLGDKINTEGKEVFPFMDSNGTLYFSSDGHMGIGELDVFYAEANGSSFGSVRNIGSDVNSSSDDFAFKYDPKTKEGYVSSNRKGGVGSDDIYAAKLIAPLCDYELNVQVVDELTKKALPGARVDLYDNTENKLATKTADKNGFVKLVVQCDKENQVLGFLQSYESNSLTITPTNQGPVSRTLILRPIEDIIADDKVVLNPIMFDYDKHNIKPKAAFELDKLVAIMKKYPAMGIKVESHTDQNGTPEYNMGLSNRRAASTMQYIISKDIDKARLTSQGFGETKPLVNCGANCTKEQNDKNRRSEFIITKK